MDFDLSFMDHEDFGLAKSFSTAPLMVMPSASLPFHEQKDFEREPVEAANEIVTDGFCFKLAPCENQIEFMKMIKEKAPKLTDFKKGTTTIAFEFKEGVIVCVDARATQGSFIASGQVRKVIEINDFLLGTMAGGAADCLFWEKYVAMQCRVMELRQGERVSVASSSKILQSIMKQYRGYGLSMGTMFTGSDINSGASLYYIDDDATRLKGQLFAVGSGGTFAYGVLDTGYRYEMSTDEAVTLAIRAVVSATHKDSASGGVVRVYHVNNQGGWTLVHDQLDVTDEHYKYEKSKGHTGFGRENLPSKWI